ncbi:hypothetical protein D5086_008730 [Populus alba]|uniref:Uncharacterized protein n=1 Tax=Populus alba TaxID=43335 RepID=A0ACC4CIP9_POPAL
MRSGLLLVIVLPFTSLFYVRFVEKCLMTLSFVVALTIMLGLLQLVNLLLKGPLGLALAVMVCWSGLFTTLAVGCSIGLLLNALLE